MNRRIFANLILYDIRKGFRENKIKWIVGVFIFVFFSFITVSDFSVNSPELGFLAYFTNILQGMPPYIKTDDSVFTIPVSWFLFYAFLFFIIHYLLFIIHYSLFIKQHRFGFLSVSFLSDRNL